MSATAGRVHTVIVGAHSVAEVAAGLEMGAVYRAPTLPAPGRCAGVIIKGEYELALWQYMGIDISGARGVLLFQQICPRSLQPVPKSEMPRTASWGAALLPVWSFTSYVARCRERGLSYCEAQSITGLTQEVRALWAAHDAAVREQQGKPAAQHRRVLTVAKSVNKAAKVVVA
ncbi:MAG: hypothetical protein ACRCV9_16230 [Burkholderiaceae bacterium]